jgi:hypothetical protein
MYEDWKLQRWDTPMSDAKNLFMESLHDHSGLLEIDLADYSKNVATARYRVTFHTYPAYRNIEEKYRLELWKRRDELRIDAKSIGWTLKVPDSPWIREFADEPILVFFNPGITHYVIGTQNDVVEVLASEAPGIEAIEA